MTVNSVKYKKYLSLLGAHLVLAPWSFIWIFGNLTAYTDSYVRFSCYPSCADCDSQWLLSATVAGNVPVLFLVKPLVKRFGLKWTGILALVLGNVALLGSAWSLQVSVAWTAVMYGVLLGTAIGTTVSVVLQVISGWASENTTILLATSSSFPTMLSVLENQIITWFVNPENFKPDARIGHRTYFSQPEILDRVPGILIILGVITLGLQTVGYLLMSNPPDNSGEKPASDKTSLATKTMETEEITQLELTQDFDSYKQETDEILEKGCSKDGNYKNTTNISNGKPIQPRCHASSTYPRKYIVLQREKKISTDNLRSWTPLETLRSPVFYAIFLFGLAIEYGLMLKSNFYKKFALLYILNDQYLTLVGTLVPIISTCSRVLFGTLVDKSILTLKDVAVFGLSVNCVMCAFWYIAPQVSHILYMFLVLGLTTAQSLFYVFMPTSTLRLFGPAHLSNNYAMTVSCVLVISIVAPVLNGLLLHTIGWFSVFAACALCNFIVLSYVLLTRFDTQRQEAL